MRVFSAQCGDGVITEIVCGKARGADAFGEWFALGNNLPVKNFPADWDKYGMFAGPLRNKQMAEYGEQLIVFWDGESRGTKSMIGEAKKKGLPTTIFYYNQPSVPRFVKLSPITCQLAIASARESWGSEKEGSTFNKGCLGDPVSPFVVGYLGELAISKAYGLPANLERAEWGDGGADFTVQGVKFDVKTTTVGKNYKGLIRSTTGSSLKPGARGFKLAFFSDYYLFCSLTEKVDLAKFEKEGTRVRLHGYMEKERLQALPDVPARVGRHFNKEVLSSSPGYRAGGCQMLRSLVRSDK